MDVGPGKCKGAGTIARKKQGPVEIGVSRVHGREKGRRYRKRSREHAPDHDAKAPLACGMNERERLGQPTCLVQFHIDHAIAANDRVQACTIVQALVSSKRHRTAQVGKIGVSTCWQRLLNELDTERMEPMAQRLDIKPRPALVCVRNEAGVGCDAANGSDAVKITLAAQLELQKFPPGHAPGLRLHGCRIAKADRVGRKHRARLRQAKPLPDPNAARFGLEIPEGRVKRVARSTCRQKIEEVSAGRARLHFGLNLAKRSKRSQGMISEIIDGRAFTAAEDFALPELNAHDLDIGLGAAGDDKWLPGREPIDGGKQRAHAKVPSGWPQLQLVSLAMTKPRRLATLRARLARDAMILWIAARDPRTPLAAKILGGLVAAYAFSPIDFIPDFVPVFGLIDDLLLLPLGLALALWLIPAPLVAEFRASADAAAARPVSRSGALLVGALWVFLVAVAAMQLVTLRYW